MQSQPALNVIGSAGGVSLNIGATNLDAMGFPGVLTNRPTNDTLNVQSNNGSLAIFGGPPARNEQATLAQTEGGVIQIGLYLLTLRLQRGVA